MVCQSNEIFEKLRSSCSCSVTKNALIAGWFGVGWRSTVSILVSYLIRLVKVDDPTIYRLGLVAVLGYVIISLTANIFFLAAILQRWSYVLLPYIFVQGIEIIIYVFLITALSTFLHALNVAAPFWSIIPSMVVIMALNIYFFAYSLMKLKHMEVEAGKKKEEDERATRKSNCKKEPPRKSFRAIRQGRHRAATSQI